MAQRICLVSRQSRAAESEPLRLKFEQAGYELEAVVLTDLKTFTSNWAVSQLKEDLTAIVLLEEPLEWVSDFASRLRSLPGYFRVVPLIFLYGSAKKVGELSWDSVVGLTDLFPVSDAPSLIRLRISLREKEAAQRAVSEKTDKEQSSKLATIDTALKQREEFLGVCAHDLRSPLALIQTSLSLAMKSEKNISATTEQLLSRAHRQSGIALGLVKDLLDVVALEQGLRPMYQLLSLDDLLKEFYADYRFQAQEKKVGFHYENPIADWLVLADGDRIRQLLQNLFTNALKFTESGKNIFLTVTSFQGRRDNDPPHPMIVIRLKDEGKGIPQSELQKIFDRFVQIKERSREGGRGLGLSVAKQISTLHDGNIWVESEEGRGSTFFVLFPHAISRLSVSPPPGHFRKVLIAEPSEEKRKLMFHCLRDWGYQLEFAKDGVEAITLLFHSRPDVLVLTPDLAKISTAEVSTLIKNDARVNPIPVILAHSAPANSRAIERILSDAAVGLPFTREAWEKALQSCRVPVKKAA